MATPFLEAMSNPADRAKVQRTFVAVIGASYARERFKPTGDETRRRFRILEKWFRILRGDKGWGVDRALGAMDAALRAELAGESFTPSERQVWVPADGAL